MWNYLVKCLEQACQQYNLSPRANIFQLLVRTTFVFKQGCFLSPRQIEAHPLFYPHPEKSTFLRMPSIPRWEAF